MDIQWMNDTPAGISRDAVERLTVPAASQDAVTCLLLLALRAAGLISMPLPEGASRRERLCIAP